jgi:hypothetical protein
MPIGDSVMTVCRDTGVSVPECSCPRCLEAQVRKHQPGLLGSTAVTRIDAIASVEPPEDLSPRRRRRAA